MIRGRYQRERKESLEAIQRYSESRPFAGAAAGASANLVLACSHSESLIDICTSASSLVPDALVAEYATRLAIAHFARISYIQNRFPEFYYPRLSRDKGPGTTIAA